MAIADSYNFGYICSPDSTEFPFRSFHSFHPPMDSTLYPSKFSKDKKFARKRTRVKVKIKKKDPLLVDGKRPRPMYVDYKDIELLTKLVNRHGRIVSRRKSGCSATSQHAVAEAVKRARFMALMPYVGE